MPKVYLTTLERNRAHMINKIKKTIRAAKETSGKTNKDICRETGLTNVSVSKAINHPLETTSYTLLMVMAALNVGEEVWD